MSSSLLTFVTLSELSLTSSFQPNSYRSTSLVPMQPISTYDQSSYDQSSKFSIQRLEPLFSTPKKQNKNEIEPSNTEAPIKGGNFDPLSYIKSKIVREKSFYSDTKKGDKTEITVSKRLSLNAKVLPKETAEETAQEAEFDPFDFLKKTAPLQYLDKNPALEKALVLVGTVALGTVPEVFLSKFTPFKETYTNMIVPFYDKLYFDFPVVHSFNGETTFDFVKMSYGYIGAALADSTLLYFYAKQPNQMLLLFLLAGVPTNLAFFTCPSSSAYSLSLFSLFLYIRYTNYKENSKI